MSSPRLKFNLYLVFKISFIVNLIVAASFTWYAFSIRSRVSALERSCLDFARMNAELSSSLSFSVLFITNEIYSVTSSFASNVLSVAASRFSSSSPVPFSPSVSSSKSPANTIDFPPLSFSQYCEIDGYPYIYVRHKIYGEGDILLGYPIQHISPDVVQYRDKFFKVDGVNIK